MKTADPEMIRTINRFHVMDAIRRRGPIARVNLCEATELSPTTVSSITAALLDDGLITALPVGTVRDTSRGRPRVLLQVCHTAAHVVGARLAPEEITIVLANFVGATVQAIRVPACLSRQPASVTADLVEDAIRRCIGDAGLVPSAVASVSIGLPGIIERAMGVCRRSPIFTETDVRFADEVSNRIGLPVAIDTDVNMVTLAQNWFGEPAEDDFLVVSVDRELGLGVVHDGQLFRGSAGLSPDISDLLVPEGQGSSGGARLGDVSSLAAILTRAAPLLPPRDLYYWTTPRGADEFAAHVAGCVELQRIVAEAGEALGQALANLVSLFSPPKVILAGPMLGTHDILSRPIIEGARRWTPRSLADVTEIVVHGWGDEIWAKGAAAMSLLSLYGAPWHTTGPAMPNGLGRKNREREVRNA